MLARILLDTCTVRNHLHATGKQLDFGAIQSSTEQLRFSLPGGVAVELLEQLMEGRVSWSDWINGITSIDTILDQRWPLMPTGRQLAAIAGTQTNIEINIENVRRRHRELWRLQRHAKSTADLQRDCSYEEVDGQKYSFNLEISKLQATGLEKRDSWKKYIHHIQSLLPSLGFKHVSEASIVTLMKMNQGTYPGDPPDLGDKLDTVARMIARLVSLALKKKNPYNPDTDKRRGDVFDISLLFYVPLPSVICTADEKFVNRLKDTGASNSRQVVTIQEFNDLVRDNKIGQLVNDFRTPLEQFQRWSEAAYFNWINRGQPINDDQHDWHESEPIA